MAATYLIRLTRFDPWSQEELQRDLVWTYVEAVGTPPLGGLVLALNYTTTVVASNGSGPGKYNFTMVRNDPYTEAPIGSLVILTDFMEDPDPGAQFPTVAAMQIALRDGIHYFVEQISY